MSDYELKKLQEEWEKDETAKRGEILHIILSFVFKAEIPFSCLCIN